MSLNYIQIFFAFAVILVTILNVMLTPLEPYLPTFFKQIMLFGKVAQNIQLRKSKFNILLPRYCFWQIYLIGVIVFTIVLIEATKVYFFHKNVPFWVLYLLDLTGGKNRMAYVKATQAYIAICLLTLQVYRRLYESRFVSVFCKNSKMHFLIYLLGMLFYSLLPLAILCESPKFALSDGSYDSFELTQITCADFIGIILFLWAWCHQHITLKILANLRFDKNGKQITEAHGLPNGDWFQYLSNPHLVAEILMYVVILIILRDSITYKLIFLTVVGNQMPSCIINHWWYLEKIPEFPKNRKALIPFIY